MSLRVCQKYICWNFSCDSTILLPGVYDDIPCTSLTAATTTSMITNKLIYNGKEERR